MNPKSSQKNGSSAEEKRLCDIFKIELVESKDGAEIRAIWEEYHKLKEVISGTIPLQLYSDIHEKMKEFPTFLFPLPRAQGYEFMLSQCHAHSVHFTPLLAYQVVKVIRIQLCKNLKQNLSRTADQIYMFYIFGCKGHLIT